MASPLRLPNPCTHSATSPTDFCHRPTNFCQVSLPNKTQKVISPSKVQSVASCSEVAPTLALESRNSSELASVWREIQGSNDWENLLEPLDPILRDEIARYGKFVNACYKAFDLNPNSKRYLNCKYGKKNLLTEVGLSNSGYEVTKYIYATPEVAIPIQNESCCGRWIGYVAVASDGEVQRLGRRDILITFRGTVTNPEWMSNFMSSLTPARVDPHTPRPHVMVESGFLSLYTSDESDSKFGLGSCREQLLSEISRLLYKYKGEELSITLAGHSMGSSLALLLAYDIAELGLNKVDISRPKIPVTVFSFGGPRVGNLSFKERCEELGVKILRVVNVNDPITKLPGVFINENFKVLGYEVPWSCSCYVHVGVQLAFDFFEMLNPVCVHDMETYISILRPTKRQEEVAPEAVGLNFIERARELLSQAHNFDPSPLRNAAANMVNLMQSPRT
ncbi:Fungal lipase-like domain [Dillenia turbinata]|uniref:Fungal lipase-like domain n=1 Tax=Dillenia turbinata TaxID=194707 RepID=A0AAN8UF96_9MAGN